MIEDYNPVILAFVLDIHTSLIYKIKDELVEAVRSLETDDSVFVYNCNDVAVARKPGPAVGIIANYRPLLVSDDFSVADAIKETVALVSMEDIDSLKFVFVLTDKKNPDIYQIRKGINFNKKYDCGCSFVFFGLGRCDESLLELKDDNADVFFPEISNLHKEIKDIYGDEYGHI